MAGAYKARGRVVGKLEKVPCHATTFPSHARTVSHRGKWQYSTNCMGLREEAENMAILVEIELSYQQGNVNPALLAWSRAGEDCK